MASLYLHSKIELKYGQLGAFNKAMAKAKAIVEEHRWKLVGARSTMIGDLNEVHDIWEIDDANAVGAVMRSAFADPAFRAVAARFAEQIEDETLTVLTRPRTAHELGHSFRSRYCCTGSRGYGMVWISTYSSIPRGRTPARDRTA